MTSSVGRSRVKIARPDLISSAFYLGWVDLIEGCEKVTEDLLSSLDHPLQAFTFLWVAAVEPHFCLSAANTFWVEVGEKSLWEASIYWVTQLGSSVPTCHCLNVRSQGRSTPSSHSCIDHLTDIVLLFSEVSEHLLCLVSTEKISSLSIVFYHWSLFFPPFFPRLWHLYYTNCLFTRSHFH